MRRNLLRIIPAEPCTVIEVNDRELQPTREVFEYLERELRQLPLNRGYCIVTRVPWAAAFISHELHPTRFVAIYDEESRSFIVVERHVKDVEIGEKIRPMFYSD
ncbi:MAG: hypothetical protein GXO26_08105 [Crenarchaeota archaeon]|nr:hypothetical protein [Thermoproteota archaeon]